MLSTVYFPAHGGPAIPPSLLFRNLSKAADDLDLSTIKPGYSRRRGAHSKLRIGNFLTFSGSPGIWGPTSTNSAVLAIDEINRRGGILGRELELSIYESGGPIEDVVRRAEQAVALDEVDLIMGSHISAVRVALRNVTRNRIPYVYTPVYEGGERTPGVMAIGETPRWQSRPAIHWLADVKKASRWYLIGSDYVWPWQSHRAVKKYIAEAGGRVVGEEFVPVGEDHHEAHLARIRAARPDVVLISLIGTDSITLQSRVRRMRPRRHHAAARRRDGRDRPARDRRRQHREPVLRLRLFQLHRFARQRRFPDPLSRDVRPPCPADRIGRRIEL